MGCIRPEGDTQITQSWLGGTSKYAILSEIQETIKNVVVLSLGSTIL